MKKLLLPAVLYAVVLATSCGNMEMKRINMAQVEQIQDSLKSIPGIVSMHVLQDDDYSKVTIIIGDPRLYGADKTIIDYTAVRVGSMLLNILGPDNNISNATFAVTQKDTDANKMPDDAKVADMKIDSLKKAMNPGK